MKKYFFLLTLSFSIGLTFVHAACGDGRIEPGEACDDGNLVNGDGCQSNCTIESDCYDPGRTFSFFTMSDSYGGQQGGVRRNLLDATNRTLYPERITPRFYLLAGDFPFFNSAGVNYYETDSSLNPALSGTHNPFACSVLGPDKIFPYFQAMGNHDVDGGLASYENKMAHFSDYLGPRIGTRLVGMRNLRWGPHNGTDERTTYSFDYKNTHIIVMNAFYGADLTLDNPVACVRQPLYDWLDQDLRTTSQPIKFVIGHEPAFSFCSDVAGNGGIDCPAGHIDNQTPPIRSRPEDLYQGGQAYGRHWGDSLEDGRCPLINGQRGRDAFWGLLKRNGVVAHFNGHTHTYGSRLVDVQDGSMVKKNPVSGYSKTGQVFNQSEGVWEIDDGNTHSSSVSSYVLTTIRDNTITFEAFDTAVGEPYHPIETWSVIVPDTSGENHPPFAYHQSTQVIQGIPMSFPLNANDDSDSHALTFQLGTSPRQGSLGSFDPVTRSVVYTSHSSASGTDTFSYTVRDSDGLSSQEANVTITIQPRVVTGRSLYVDRTLPAASCATYNPGSRSCAGGAEQGFQTIQMASEQTQPGDTIYIRAGTFSEPLIPAVSGEASQPITFKNFPFETPELNYVSNILSVTGQRDDTGDIDYRIGIYLYRIHHVIIEGLLVKNVHGWFRAFESHHNIIRNNRFEDAFATGTTASLKFIRSDRNVVAGNTILRGQDNITIYDSDYNLVENNRVESGRHSIFGIKCGNYNVLRNNYFTNPIQKIGEIFDCEVVSGDQDTIIKNDATKFNVVERNVFDTTAADDGNGPYNGIQFAGQNTIFRKNVIFNSRGMAVGMARYPNEAMFNKHNRFYNNVFAFNQGGGTVFSNLTEDPNAYIGNIFKNNIYYMNTPIPLGWADNDPSGYEISHRFGGGGYRMENNNIYNPDHIGETIWISRNTYSLSQIQGNSQYYPLLYQGNLELNPNFVNPTIHDFHLNTGSAMINRGAFLTTTLSAGAGTVIPVADAMYFYNGHGITNGDGLAVAGDLIRLDGQTATSRVVHVDYENNTLTVDNPLTWTANQGISVNYAGSDPDMGAFEFGLSEDAGSLPGRPPIDPDEGSGDPLSPSGFLSFPNILRLNLGGSMTIRFVLGQAADVSLTVYDRSGKKVNELVKGPLPAGEQIISWLGRNEKNERVAAGVFHAVLIINGTTYKRKLVVVK